MLQFIDYVTWEDFDKNEAFFHKIMACRLNKSFMDALQNVLIKNQNKSPTFVIIPFIITLIVTN